MIKSRPLDSVQRFGIANAIALRLVRSIVHAAAVTVPHPIAATFLDDAGPRVGFTIECVGQADSIQSIPDTSVGRFSVFDLVDRFRLALNPNKARRRCIPESPLI